MKMGLINKLAGAVKYVGNTVVAAAGTLYLTGCMPNTEQTPKIELGYNALEATPTHEGDFRTRAITNATVKTPHLEIRHHGLNEANNFDENTNFGNNRLMVGHPDFPVKAVVDMITNKDGIASTKFGIRDYWIVKQIGGYGFIEALRDEDSSTITLFYGKPIGKGFSIEGFVSATLPDGGNINTYNEIQLYEKIAEHLSLTARWEWLDEKMDEGTGLVGIVLHK